MHAVKIDASDKEIGVTSETERGEIAAVASAPETDALGINIGAGSQKFSRGDHVLIFGGAASSAARSFAERAAVADSAAVIERQDDVAAAGEILVHGIGIRVVVHVMPAAKHLANGAAVKKNQRGTLVA